MVVIPKSSISGFPERTLLHGRWLRTIPVSGPTWSTSMFAASAVMRGVSVKELQEPDGELVNASLNA
jgi:hypothetical protein